MTNYKEITQIMFLTLQNLWYAYVSEVKEVSTGDKFNEVKYSKYIN